MAGQLNGGLWPSDPVSVEERDRDTAYVLSQVANPET
jgi:hypothetical protein